jgi:UDP-N-acetylglucosamine 4,6-dehydratase/5-epimerase
LLAEKLVMTGDIGEGCKTKFSCVRFGNVLNSIGSVIPIFKQQIKEGGPLTITSKDMVRFFMTMSEAVNLVLKAAHLAKGRDIFVLNMNKIRIIDLAEVMIEKMALRYGYGPTEIKIKLIGVRPGEKINEHLVTEEEKDNLINLGNLSVLKVHKIFNSKKRKNRTVGTFKNKDINDGIILSKKEISELLDKHQLCND